MPSLELDEINRETLAWSYCNLGCLSIMVSSASYVVASLMIMETRQSR
jgi:hypothetical protein